MIGRPITVINNQSARSFRVIKSRPLSQLGMIKMRDWLSNKDWSSVYEARSASDKAAILQKNVLESYKRFFPIKTHRVS